MTSWQDGAMALIKVGGLEFRCCGAGRSPAKELIAATLAEYDASAGRKLRGGPSATPEDFSPPRGHTLSASSTGYPPAAGVLRLWQTAPQDQAHVRR